MGNSTGSSLPLKVSGVDGNPIGRRMLLFGLQMVFHGAESFTVLWAQDDQWKGYKVPTYNHHLNNLSLGEIDVYSCKGGSSSKHVFTSLVSRGLHLLLRSKFFTVRDDRYSYGELCVRKYTGSHKNCLSFEKNGGKTTKYIYSQSPVIFMLKFGLLSQLKSNSYFKHINLLWAAV